MLVSFKIALKTLGGYKAERAAVIEPVVAKIGRSGKFEVIQSEQIPVVINAQL